MNGVLLKAFKEHQLFFGCPFCVEKGIVEFIDDMIFLNIAFLRMIDEAADTIVCIIS